jgi:hypothetical protein
MSDPTPGLHPAQNRALRECYAVTRQLVRHWRTLAGRLGRGSPSDELAAGATAADELLAELGDRMAGYGLFGGPAAAGVGTSLAGTRNVLADRALERNQAARVAVLDGQHLVTLLAYLAALAQANGDAGLTAWCAGWEARLTPLVDAARNAAIATGEDPERAIAPADPGALGRAGHAAALAAGAFGEWFDRSARRGHIG